MFIISMIGSSSSGKTYISQILAEYLKKNHDVLIINLDSFYKESTDSKNRINFDLPEKIDFDLLLKCLKELEIDNKTDKYPVYDFSTHKRVNYKTLEYKGKCIIIEGLFVLNNNILREKINLKIFIETDLDICLLRRIKRDINERSRTLESILYQYENHVKPSYIKYIFPYKNLCDIVIPNNSNNQEVLKIEKYINNYFTQCI